MLNPSEALYGFVSWLTTRKEVTTMSAVHDSAPIAELVKEFCDRNELPPLSETWTDGLKLPVDSWFGGAQNRMTIKELRDESGNVIHSCAVGSFPLPKDHWIYNEPIEPAPITEWMNETFRLRVRSALKYAVQVCTSNGKDMDFDPDALRMEFERVLFGNRMVIDSTDINMTQEDPSPLEADTQGALKQNTISSYVNPQGWRGWKITTTNRETLEPVELVQFHWQDRNDLSKTQFVAQSDGFKKDDNGESFRKWIQDIMDRRGSECPEGWMPMVCGPLSDYFVRAADDVLGDAPGRLI